MKILVNKLNHWLTYKPIAIWKFCYKMHVNKIIIINYIQSGQLVDEFR